MLDGHHGRRNPVVHRRKIDPEVPQDSDEADDIHSTETPLELPEERAIDRI
jgi:hypothetical protein